MLVEQGEGGVDLALGCGGEAAAGLHDPLRCLVGSEVGGHDRQGLVEPGDESVDDGREFESAVEHDARQRRERARRVRGEGGEQHLAAVARDHHEGALHDARKHVLHRHARDDDAKHFARQKRLVTLQQATVDRAHDGAHGGCDQIRILGYRPRGHPRHGCHGIRHRVEQLRLDPIRHDREEAGVRVGEFGQCEFGDLPEFVGRARPGLVGFAPGEHQQHRRAQVGGNAGVEGELGRGGNIRVVRPDDDDGVALALDRLEAIDDAREGGIRILVHLLVGDPDALVVVESDTVSGEQQLENEVGLGRRPRHRAEHPDPGRRAQEGVEHTERD